MDHRGRFAKGCLTCRQRKIKCDEARPSCNRCLTGRWTCPGYTELTDLTFRNYFMVVAKNAQTHLTQKIGNPNVGVPMFHAHTTSHSLVTKQPSIPRSLTLDLESTARAYFLSRHIITNSETLARGQYEFLPALLAGQHVNSALDHSLNAAAFAAFGNSHNSIKMLQHSRLECARAIQALNIALKCPETAASDDTLVSAMLLSTFEVITYLYQQDGGSCINQLTGRLALLMIRGPEQLDTRFGLQIFLQAYFLVVSACIHREHALPSQFSALRFYIQPYLDAGSYTWCVLDLMARFADLVDALKNQNTQVVEHRKRLIALATKLDDDFQEVTSSLPSSWRYETVPCSDTDLVYNNFYHIYSDPWVIRYWNYMRLCRIRMHQIFLDNSQPVLNSCGLQHHTISATITQLSADICATVPQHTGHLQPLQPQRIGPQPASDKNLSTRQESSTYTAGIYSLLYPLLVVARLKTTPVSQREWIIYRLEHLGRISGISQAFAAVETIRSDTDL